MKENNLLKNGIYYRTNDFEASKETILFIHGLSGCSSAWEPYEREFMDKYNIVSIDLRGHGRSKKYVKESDYAIELFIEDIEAVLAHLGIEEYVVASHSFGSVISVGLILKRSAMIKGAVFLSPAFKERNSLSTKAVRCISCLSSNFLRIFPTTKDPGKDIDYSRFIPTRDWDWHRICIDIMNTGLAVYFFCLHSLYRSMSNDFFGRLELPVLIIHGKKDSIVSVSHSIKASKNIRGAKLVVLPDADHMLIFNYAKEISRIMSEFLASVD
ncbi:MAG: alpha/beta hydrolase [Candidatus Pacebacteria bacterium]|nr:alpha/beta hydrolase [Candidatus Paceibacterota bacterium]